ncbi:hypothetical protein [Caulobacter endophyticus]|uniref:hypothetical protein n=1 Tax=Caulobacter endophyticus TaxID=2172652 RepID=UPI00240F7961|nr:hypothetical protein [Caulobacter endophyticus]MDG2531572.1 hypothetical protein [Caulobacter endophyticus]
MTSQARCALAPPARRSKIAAGEVVIRFTVSPTPAGHWLWKVFGSDGKSRVEGLAASRKHAAALIIHEILILRAAAAIAAQKLSATAA